MNELGVETVEILFEAYIEIKSIKFFRLDIKIRDKGIDMLRSKRNHDDIHVLCTHYI